MSTQATQAQNSYEESAADICIPNLLGTIGDQVWQDTNGSGLKGRNEVGIPNVTVTLHAADGLEIGRETTDENGWYLFTDLPLGLYQVCIDTATLPDGYTPTYDLDGRRDHQAAVELAPGEEERDVDFGYRPPVSSVGDWVWVWGGRLGWEKIGLAGVTVTICNATGSINRTMQTSRDGLYHFHNLPAGEYTISIDPETLPENVVPTYDRDRVLDNETTVCLSAGQDVMTADFSYRSRRRWWPILFGILGWIAFFILLIIWPPTQPPPPVQADLTVEVLTLSLAEQIGCDDVQLSDAEIEVRVHNGSALDVGAFQVTLNGEAQMVDGLAAGASETVTFALPSASQLEAIVDAENQISESNEENNRDEVSLDYETMVSDELTCDPIVVPGKPELSVELLANCMDEQTAVVELLLFNSGSEAAEQVMFTLNGESETIGRLDAASFERMSFTVEASEFTAVIDPNNGIDEGNEDNNSATATVDLSLCEAPTPPPLPDLTVSITADPPAGCGDDATTVATVTVTNLSPTAAGQFVLTIGEASEMIRGLAGDEALTVEATVSLGEITAVVDAANQIDESNENNNVASTTVTANEDEACTPESAEADLSVAIGCSYNEQERAYDLVVEARNDEAAAVGSFVLNVNGQTAVIAGLAQAEKAQHSFRFPEGTANFIARVDAQNQIAERNEANNQSVLYIERLPDSASCKVTYESCTRVDFEIGREAVTGVRQAGTFVVREAENGRFVTSWRARADEVDSGIHRNFTLPRRVVHVTVDFVPDNGGAPVRMEILNPAPGTPYGWLAQGQCHALEVQYPAAD